MREVTQGMIDRYEQRADSLGRASRKRVDAFGEGRRAQLVALRREMGVLKYHRKWDPILKRRYIIEKDGRRRYFPTYHTGRKNHG